MNSSSSAAATSGSFSGSTCWRETSSVTFEPRASNMCVNSTPVTPEPTTTMCSGSSGGGYAWRVVSTRSPSTGANSGTRGGDPLAQRVQIDAALGLQAHHVAAGQLGQLATGGDHRLGGDAVPQVRGAGDDVALDQRHLRAERGRDGGARVAGGPAAEDRDSYSRKARQPPRLRP